MRNTILIVEDDEMVRQGIVDALQLRNWKRMWQQLAKRQRKR